MGTKTQEPHSPNSNESRFEPKADRQSEPPKRVLLVELREGLPIEFALSAFLKACNRRMPCSSRMLGYDLAGIYCRK